MPPKTPIRFNFSSGPAVLPLSVMQKIKEEFCDYQGMGASIIEISHRSTTFMDLLQESLTLFAEVGKIPKSHRIIYVPGGARLLFSAIPMNLLRRTPTLSAQYVDSGEFAHQALVEAQKFGTINVLASSREDRYKYIPPIDTKRLDHQAAYVHVTANNTVYGTAFHEYPNFSKIPMIVDATSDLLSRPFDFDSAGLVYGSFQKNLGPSGLSAVIIREDLLDFAPQDIPLMLHFKWYVEQNSIGNTINTFSVYVLKLMLEWIKDSGGVAGMGKLNTEKSSLIYDVIDQDDFYVACADKSSRSHVNVTFRLANTSLDAKFQEESDNAGLYALAGHRFVGGFRASMYNGMPLEGAQALAEFMKAFRSRYG